MTRCRRCGAQNSGGRETCWRCGIVLLDIHAIMRTDRRVSGALEWALVGIFAGGVIALAVFLALTLGKLRPIATLDLMMPVAFGGAALGGLLGFVARTLTRK